MKVRLNITIEEEVVKNIKSYAEKKQSSVSALVEDYFNTISKPNNKKNIIEMVEALKAPVFPKNIDLKKSFYEDKKAKYGF